MYCVGVLEGPDGAVIVSGDGKDKAYVWRVEKKSDAEMEEESKANAPIQNFKTT